jgi:outer membrane receptor for ferrienterochelin and colicins
MTLKQFIAIICLGSLCWTIYADRQGEKSADIFDMSIQQLLEQRIDTVVTASKREQKITEAPSSVTVITAEEIRRLGYRTLVDILDGVRGFYKTYDRNYSYIGVRGFGRPGDYNSRILFLIDGYRLNDNIGDSAWIGTDFCIDVDLIERIEIIRGPGSALYGSNAFFAVINVITKKGADYKGTELAGSLSSFNTKQARVTYGNTFGKGFDILVSGSKYDSAGPRLYFSQFDDPSTNNGHTTNDDDRFDNFLIKTSFPDFKIIAVHNSREKGIPTSAWGTLFNNKDTRTFDSGTLIGITYQKELSEWLSMLGRLSYNNYNYRGHYAYDYGLNKDLWNGQWYIGEAQLIYKINDIQTLVFGSESQYNIHQNQKNWDCPGDVSLDSKEKSKSYGLYIEDEFKITDNFILNAGIRRDYYDSFGSTVNPRLAMIYNLDSETAVKLLYGRAFRAPSAYELYYHDGYFTAKPSADLKPETINTYEIICEKYLNKNMFATAGLFYYKVKDLIDQTLDPADDLLVFKNLTEVSAKGFETELKADFDNGLQARLGYSFVQTFDKSTRSTLANSPKHIVNCSLIYPLIKNRFYAGIENIYNSGRKTLIGSRTDDFLITNLTLTYDNAVKGLDLQLGLYNLFDVKYGYPGFNEHIQDTDHMMPVINQDGRTVGVKATYRF